MIEDRYKGATGLNGALQDLLVAMGQSDETERLAARITRIYSMYRSIIECVYRQTAQQMLDHTNSVYIAEKDGQRHLTVYVDESIYAADLNAQRELVKLLFLQEFNESIDVFNIYVSRGKYKANHPFKLEDEEEQPKEKPLTAEEKKWIEESVQAIEDPLLREHVEKAMIATMKYEFTENSEKR